MQRLVERTSLRETENIGDAVREAGWCTSLLNRTGNIAVQFRSPRFRKKKEEREKKKTAPAARRIGRPEFFLISLKNSLSFAGAVRY